MANKKVSASSIISIVLYVLAGILIVYTIWSIVNMNDYIAQQQVSFKGNEYSIINFYMSGAGQYAIFAVILFAFGWIIQKSSCVCGNAEPEICEQVEFEELGTFADVSDETENAEEVTSDASEDFDN